MYKVDFTTSAHKQYKKLPMDISIRIFNGLAEFANNPTTTLVKKLKGIDGFRLRIGDYRIIYTIDHKKEVIRITSISHRKKAY